MAGPGIPAAASPEPTITNDLLPTALSVVGLPVPADRDGVDLSPVLRSGAELGREALYFHYPHYHHDRPAGAVVVGDLKLIEYFDDWSVELYDLAADPGERNDLAEARPADLIRLRALLGDWRHSVDAPMPMPNPDYEPERAGEWWHRKHRQPFDLEREHRLLEPWKYP